MRVTGGLRLFWKQTEKSTLAALSATIALFKIAIVSATLWHFIAPSFYGGLDKGDMVIEIAVLTGLALHAFISILNQVPLPLRALFNSYMVGAAIHACMRKDEYSAHWNERYLNKTFFGRDFCEKTVWTASSGLVFLLIMAVLCHARYPYLPLFAKIGWWFFLFVSATDLILSVELMARSAVKHVVVYHSIMRHLRHLAQGVFLPLEESMASEWKAIYGDSLLEKNIDAVLLRKWQPHMPMNDHLRRWISRESITYLISITENCRSVDWESPAIERLRWAVATRMVEVGNEIVKFVNNEKEYESNLKFLMLFNSKNVVHYGFSAKNSYLFRSYLAWVYVKNGRTSQINRLMTGPNAMAAVDLLCSIAPPWCYRTPDHYASIIEHHDIIPFLARMKNSRPPWNDRRRHGPQPDDGARVFCLGLVSYIRKHLPLGDDAATAALMGRALGHVAEGDEFLTISETLLANQCPIPYRTGGNR